METPSRAAIWRVSWPSRTDVFPAPATAAPQAAAACGSEPAIEIAVGKPSTYLVEPRGDGWAIAFGGRIYGHRTLTAATTAAMKAALRSAAHGHRSQLLSRRRDGSWVLVWDSEAERFGAIAARP